MDEIRKNPEVAHATPALVQAVAALGKAADGLRYPNAAVVLVVGCSIIVRVPLTDNAAFERGGWSCLKARDGLWALDMRDPEYTRKKTLLSRISAGLTATSDS